MERAMQSWMLPWAVVVVYPGLIMIGTVTLLAGNSDMEAQDFGPREIE